MKLMLEHFKENVQLLINVHGIGYLLLGQFCEFLKADSIFIRRFVVGDG